MDSEDVPEDSITIEGNTKVTNWIRRELISSRGLGHCRSQIIPAIWDPRPVAFGTKYCPQSGGVYLVEDAHTGLGPQQAAGNGRCRRRIKINPDGPSCSLHPTNFRYSFLEPRHDRAFDVVHGHGP